MRVPVQPRLEAGRLFLLLGAGRRSLPKLLAAGLSVGLALGAANAGQGKVAPRTHPALGAEQANQWMPLDAIRLDTEAARRKVMIDRIRDEVARRHSTIDARRLDHVLAIMSRIAREQFVAASVRKSAYLPASLDIGFGQTISDAYIVAIMTTAAEVSPHANVLDIGTGSGYQAAVLGHIARTVTSVEIVPQLALQARARLRRLGYANVTVLQGDGFAGRPAQAPFDAIIVAAGTTIVPPALVDQLKTGGRLVVPVGPSAREEELIVVTKRGNSRTEQCSLGLAMFVPLTGMSRRAANVARPVAHVSRKYRMCYDAPVT